MNPADRRALALVGLAAVFAHLTALCGGLVWLDHSHIQEGLALAPAGEFVPLFTRGFAGTGFYRPLMSVSLSLDAALGGATWLYHATSLLWHAAAAVMVALAAQALAIQRRAALLAGVLFAVHPVTSLVASAIAFRSESMIAVALLALIVAHRRKQPWAAALALAGGALTKETGLVLGLAIIATLELDGRERLPQRHRLLLAEGAALVSVVALRLAFAPPWRAAFVPLPAGAAIGTRLAALSKSALAVVLPVDRTVCDAFPITGLVSVWSVAGLVVLGGLVWLAWKRRGPALLLLLALLPVLQLVPIMRWWSPHYLYVPLCFAAMLVAERVMAAGRRALMAAALVTAGLAALVLRDDLRFRNDDTLWGPEVAANDACREGHFYLGSAALERHDLPAAATHFEHALADRPAVQSYVDRPAALQNLGVIRLQQGALPAARTAFRRALEHTSDERARRRLTHNLATAELRAGNPQEAARLLAPEVGRGDALPESLLVCARALHELGRESEAGVLVHRLQGRAAH